MSRSSQSVESEHGRARVQAPTSGRFAAFLSQGWAAHPAEDVSASPVASFAAERRRALASQFPSDVLLIGAGVQTVRSNDTFHLFRPHSAFAHLTGWGADAVPGAVLVLDDRLPSGSALYFRAPAGRDTDEFYADPVSGEFWTGRRPGLLQISVQLGMEVRDISRLADDLAKLAGRPLAAVDAEDLTLDEILPAHDPRLDERVATAASELRLVKDDFEVSQLREAIRLTHDGFEDVIRALPEAVRHPRGERVVEGAFAANARKLGNGVGYETIAAAGAHACVLHWMRNDGVVLPGDLLLLDAGVEADSLYTADVTRTLPVSGHYSPAQREVYEAVLEAADAAFLVARPGNRFRDVHEAALEVIARHVSSWGMLPISLEETLLPENMLHRRYMVHGTSHHLGLDVHDCALARREMYKDAVIQPGMVFTIEPGLYFQPDDLTVPEQFRGIGVRIEDDVLITEDGCEPLTAAFPRRPDDIEQWMATLLP